MNKKIKVLCFTDFNTGRDAEMVLLVRRFAERFLNCEFVHAISFDIHRIYKDKPDIVFTPNTIGSTLYWEIARAARNQDVPVFSLISEGNFKTDDSFDYWGYNRDKIFYQDFVCCWSERTRKYLAEKEPDLKDKIVLTGGVGFDRYKLYQFSSKTEFLLKYNRNSYKKVVGYGAWTFNKMNYPRGRSDIYKCFGNDEGIFIWLENQRKILLDIWGRLIRNNPDVLFIFKKHPQDKPSESVINAINELPEYCDFDNVLFFNDEEPLQNLIYVSDVWTCFESTTAVEAWLMGKQTIFINSEPDFPRSEIYLGSSVAHNYEEIQGMLDKYFINGSIDEFIKAEKKIIRKNLIANTIGYDDGLNHVRACFYLKKTINKINSDRIPNYKFSIIFYLYHLFVIIGGTFYVKSLFKYVYKLKKHLWVFENYKMEEIEKLYNDYSVYLDKFYSNNFIDEKYLDQKIFEEN